MADKPKLFKERRSTTDAWEPTTPWPDWVERRGGGSQTLQKELALTLQRIEYWVDVYYTVVDAKRSYSGDQDTGSTTTDEFLSVTIPEGSVVQYIRYDRNHRSKTVLFIADVLVGDDKRTAQLAVDEDWNGHAYG